jgi:hypothetical protein
MHCGRENPRSVTEHATVTAQLSELDRPATSFVATGEKILELVKRAGILYETQDPTKQHRVLESVLSNRIFDRGSLCPTYSDDTVARLLLVRPSASGSRRKSWRVFSRRVTAATVPFGLRRRAASAERDG